MSQNNQAIRGVSAYKWGLAVMPPGWVAGVCATTRGGVALEAGLAGQLALGDPARPRRLDERVHRLRN